MRLGTREGVPDEDIGKGATLDNQLMGRRSAIVGHGQNLLRVGTLFFRIQSGLAPWVRCGDGGSTSYVYFHGTLKVIK